MKKINKILDWLSGFGAVRVDYLGKGAYSMALFPQGRRELSRRQDILGAAQVRWEEPFLLRLRLPLQPEGDGGENERLLAGLQEWVSTHPAPQLGTEQTQSVENARLAAAESNGLAVYEAKIVLRYTQSA